MTLDPRVGLLTLVRQQIDLTLTQVVDAAAKHATATMDNSALQPCVAQLHQVSGALRMVQLPGAARFAGEIETAVKAALRGIPADKTEAATAGRAAGTLRDFINEVAGGGAYTPLQLVAAYRELAKVSGNDAASEKDLFFPEVLDNAPPHANPRPITPAILPALVKDLRSRYQRGLLGWLKESGKPDGLVQMRSVLDALYQIAAQLPEPRGLWWASTTLLDCVVELLPTPAAAEWIARVKPVCSRIDFLLRDLAARGTADTAPAQRDVYYAIASCRTATARLREVQRVLNLDNLIPDTQQADSAALSRQPLLDDARTRLDNLKGVWTEYVAGEPNRLARFRELITPLTQKARELGNVPLLQLLLAVNGATPQLPDPYPLDGQVMSLEMASALLMAENIVAHFHQLPPDLEQQVTIMKGWLGDAVAGKLGTASPPGLRADIVQKANDEKLRIATAREIIKSLQQVEKTVEAYANGTIKKTELAPLNQILRQVRGVFDVSNQKRAARLALACQNLLERCAGGSSAEPRHNIEWLAEGLGSLGFYLEPCLHGKEPAERAVNRFFTRYENKQGFEALLELSQRLAVQPAAAPAAAKPAPTPAAPGADREMVEVFLEEANEVLTAVEASVTQARASVSNGADDQDALINMRRAFHTLKGSARMVGLTAFGECAWDMEQVMNHWLAQAHTATPELLNLCDDARTLLAEWAHALQGEDAPTIDANDIAQRARAIRGMAPAVEIAAPSPAPAPVAATPAPTAPAVATLEAAEALDPHAATTLSITGHLEPSYEQTLLDLGDRLSWLNGLVEEIQEQAGTGGGGVTTPSRVTEIANMMGESMSEALALHRALQAQLALQIPGKN